MGFQTYIRGRGLVDSDVLSVERALNEYDERLYFDRNQDTGQWCAYLKTGPADPDIPVMGWDYIPDPHDAIKRIYQADTLRGGSEILEQIDRANAEVERPYEEAASDASGQLAEGLEWGFRKMGAHPQARIFVPR